MKSNPGLYELFVKDGVIPFVSLGIILLFTGLFLIIQSMSGHFLPHDLEAIGMTAEQLSYYKNGRIAKFMFHDRVSYGGALVSVGVLYVWLALVPLKRKQSWAWWVFLFSGVYGFGSFLSYLGFGYFDSWHGIGTIAILPFFILGLYHSYHWKQKPNIASLRSTNKTFSLKSRLGKGNILLLVNAVALFLGGVIIMLVGMSSVFVPEDLEYMNILVCNLEDINPNLVPVIAHDRASFGGGLAVIGIMLFFIVWYAKPTKVLWETLGVSITIGYLSAIVVHFVIGYLNFLHLLPAFIGFAIFICGLFLVEKEWSKE